MIKPEWLGDPSIGHFVVLGCPKCDKPILFSSYNIEHGNVPPNCEYCKEEFDWRDVPLV